MIADAEDKTVILPEDPLTASADDGRTVYASAQRSAAFILLRSRSRRYVTAMTLVVLGGFAGVVVVAGWFPDVFAAGVAGNVNAGMVVAVGLIVLPAVTCVIHLRYATRRLDPLAERVRDDVGRRRQ